MSATLALARQAFMRDMYRDTEAKERPRMLAVLDALIKWSQAHPGELQFRADDNEKGIVRFERVGQRTVFWSATPRRNAAPALELLPSSSRTLAAGVRERCMETLASHTREFVDPDGRMQISFGALKNEAATNAVLALMSELLVTAPAEPAGGAASASASAVA